MRPTPGVSGSFSLRYCCCCSIGELTAVLFLTELKLRCTPAARSCRNAKGLRPSLSVAPISFANFSSSGDGRKKMTRHQHVPVIFFLDELFQITPPFVVHELGNRGLSVNIYQSVRDDCELAMAGRQVEVGHQIAVGIGIAKNPGARIDRQLKNKTALVTFASMVHANFHHALPDEMAVAIASEMANGVEH